MKPFLCKMFASIASAAVLTACGVDAKRYCVQLSDGQLASTVDGKNFGYMEEVRNTTPEDRNAGFWHLDKERGQCKMRGAWFSKEPFKAGGLPAGATLHPRGPA